MCCTDFTYLKEKDGNMRYNCTSIDLYERSAVVTLDGAHITTELAVEALNIALKRHKSAKGFILLSDQSRQFAAKKFNDFCKKNHIEQSMSKAECPYDYVAMEHFYNTLKNEGFNFYRFKSIDDLDQKFYEFVYVKYNHVRPHSYHVGLTSYAAYCTAQGNYTQVLQFCLTRTQLLEFVISYPHLVKRYF